MKRKFVRWTIAVFGLWLAFACGYILALGQMTSGQDPMFGIWTMDLSKSVNNRNGDHRKPTIAAERRFERDGDGFRMSFTADPGKLPPLVYLGHADGREYPDPRNPERQETLTHWRMNPNVILRQRKTKERTTEWVVYTISSDGKTFVATSWDPVAPDLQDFQVYTRAK